MSSCTVMQNQLDKKRGGESMVLQETMNLENLLLNFMSLKSLRLGLTEKNDSLAFLNSQTFHASPLKNEDYFI